jgi:hypothetical protein
METWRENVALVAPQWRKCEAASLPFLGALWNRASMNLRFLLRGIFLALVVMGLVLGSFAVPMNAAPMTDQAQAAMAEGMPCADEKTSLDLDCKRACPLMSVCIGSCFSTDAPRASGPAAAPVDTQILFCSRHDAVAALTTEPPNRPPQA